MIECIADLLKHDKAGDPVHGLKWTRKTTRKIAAELRRLGIRISAKTVGRLLREMGFSLRVNHKTLESGNKNPPPRRVRNRQFKMAVVPADERSAAGGFTGIARTTGAAISPLFAGFLFARPSLISVPFFIAGLLKIVHDLMLYKGFVTIPPPEERVGPQ